MTTFLSFVTALFLQAETDCLGHQDYRVREAAQAHLAALGPVAAEALRVAARSTDAERAARAAALLGRCQVVESDLAARWALIRAVWGPSWDNTLPARWATPEGGAALTRNARAMGLVSRTDVLKCDPSRDATFEMHYSRAERVDHALHSLRELLSRSDFLKR